MGIRIVSLVIIAGVSPGIVVGANQFVSSEQQYSSDQQNHGVLVKVARSGSQGMNMSRVEQLAIQHDALISRHMDLAEAMDAKAVAARQNPDPKFKIGLMNVPVDTFDFAQEPMTQQVLGIQQMFPPGDKLTHRSKRMEFMGQAKRAQADQQELALRRDVRSTWLDIYQQHHAINILKHSQSVFDELVQIVRFQYRAGRGTQQDILRAQLELSMLQDKELEVAGMMDMSLAKLSKLAGSQMLENSLQLGSLTLPVLPGRAQIASRLKRHPMVDMKEQMSNSAQEAVEIARANYDMGWALDLSYGMRQESPQGMVRADFLSAMVMIDLPFFTGKRQDQALLASEREYSASRNDLVEAQRMLQVKLDAKYSIMERLQQRLSFYRDVVLPKSSQNAEAALKSYQSRTTGFGPLMRARLMELKNKLTALKLLVEHGKTQVELLYLAGNKV